jgi:5-methylcytosine-specific restriction endonuclease McrA
MKVIKKGRDLNREKVRVRDNHTCQDCGKKWEEGQRRFDVHHLNNLCGKKSRGYDKISEMDILITLCHKCHFNRPEHKTKINKKPKIIKPKKIKVHWTFEEYFRKREIRLKKLSTG